ncbi:hypothetical protein F5876DRAFT_83519 [Lentinula aff. lateritia]|uniref:Uncharacterized protein n=1 Tax=Lentinula aff. lateritia TaxID=2804960 RepID=A0ACC1THR0_9AGAR|nr:hypothetical protein F5876DRAFT_83519 [Lentinula aff. lateritia]
MSATTHYSALSFPFSDCAFFSAGSLSSSPSSPPCFSSSSSSSSLSSVSSSTLLLFRTLGFTDTVLDGPGVADPAIDSLVSMAINLPFTPSCLLRICRSEPLGQLALHDSQPLPGSPFSLLAHYQPARIGAPDLGVMAGFADDGVSLALLLQARNLLDLALPPPLLSSWPLPWPSFFPSTPSSSLCYVPFPTLAPVLRRKWSAPLGESEPEVDW